MSIVRLTVSGSLYVGGFLLFLGSPVVPSLIIRGPLGTAVGIAVMMMGMGLIYLGLISFMTRPEFELPKPKGGKTCKKCIR